MAYYAHDGGFPETVSPFYTDQYTPQLTFLVKTSDGVDSGKYEAAEDFHKSFGWVYRNYPKKEFQIVPFSFDQKYGGVKAYLMVEQVKSKEKAEQ